MAYVYAACSVCVTTGVEFQNPCLPRSTVTMFIATPSDQGTMDSLVHTASN